MLKTPLSRHPLFDRNLLSMIHSYVQPVVPWGILRTMEITEDDLVFQGIEDANFSYVFISHEQLYNPYLEDHVPRCDCDEGSGDYCEHDHYYYVNAFSYKEKWHNPYYSFAQWTVYELTITAKLFW